MPGVSRCDRGDYTRVLPTHCTRGCGCNGHPAFPTPSWANGSCTTRAHRAARRERVLKLAVLKIEVGVCEALLNRAPRNALVMPGLDPGIHLLRNSFFK